MIPEKFADFIIAVTGNRIECEGERQKYSKYIIVFRVFRFLSPTKLNRDEQTDTVKLIPFNHCAYAK